MHCNYALRVFLQVGVHFFQEFAELGHCGGMVIWPIVIGHLAKEFIVVICSLAHVEDVEVVAMALSEKFEHLEIRKCFTYWCLFLYCCSTKVIAGKDIAMTLGVMYVMSRS